MNLGLAVQGVVVDAVVAGAALWLVWSFGPERWRARLTRGRPRPGYDRALQADELDGGAPAVGQARVSDEDCGPHCGC